MDIHLIDESSSEQEQEDFFTQADDEPRLDPVAAAAAAAAVPAVDNRKTAPAVSPSSEEAQDEDKSSDLDQSLPQDVTAAMASAAAATATAETPSPKNPEEKAETSSNSSSSSSKEAITEAVDAAVAAAAHGDTMAALTTTSSEDQEDDDDEEEEEEVSEQDQDESSYEEKEVEDDEGKEEEEKGEMTFEKEDNEEEEEETTPKEQDDTQNIPAQFAWLRTTARDQPIWCAIGNKEVENIAYPFGQPFYDMISHTWLIQVCWDARNSSLKTRVPCNLCKPVKLQTSQRITRSRDTVKPTFQQQQQERSSRSRTRKATAAATTPLTTPPKRLVRLQSSPVQSFRPSLSSSESPVTSPVARLLQDDDDDSSSDGDKVDTMTTTARTSKRPLESLSSHPMSRTRPDVPFKGMKLRKKFQDNKYYWGTVTSDTPRTVERPDGALVLAWPVRYEDDDEEELELAELMRYRKAAAASLKQAPTTAATVTPSILDDDDEAPLTSVARKQQSDDSSENEMGAADRPSKRARRLFQSKESNAIAPAAATNVDDEVDRILAEEDKRAKLERFYQWTKEHVCNLPGILPEEAEEALRLIGPPYGLQEVTRKAMEIRDMKKWQEPTVLLEPKPGMKVRRTFGGEYFTGEVTEDEPEMIIGKEGKLVKVWKIRFPDGDEEDLELDEILRYRYDRPREPAPCRGRPLQSLELFCGRGVVTQEFAERKWRVQSIDNSWDSNATSITSIMDIRFEELDFTPDFIWASPPCQTYSRLAGGKHRSIKNGELEKSDEALEHNYYFSKMMDIMRKAKKKHPHLIVVIENPQGSLRMMPLMKAFKDEFNLWEVTVNYCAFGRDEKKPTMLWTNDIGLKGKLSRFTCQDMCPYSRNGEPHPVGVQTAINKFDFSVIPQPLAEEVAEYVHSRFFMDDIHWKKAVDPAATDAA